MTDESHKHFTSEVTFEGKKISGALEKKVKASVVKGLNSFLGMHLFGEELVNIEPTVGLSITVDDSPHRIYIGYADWESKNGIHCKVHHVENAENTEYQQLHAERTVGGLRIMLDAQVDQNFKEKEEISVFSTGGSKSEPIVTFYIAGPKAGVVEFPNGALNSDSHARAVLRELQIDIDRLDRDPICKDEVLHRFRNMLFGIDQADLED